MHRDAILFFRLGDFYEMFQQDAKEASAILGLTLTRRNGVPMCGLPYHASHSYIEKLLKAGRKIAICEQVRLPRDGKGIADREVVEIISPGTVVDEDYLDRGENNYLVALAGARGGLSLSAVDVSTGDFAATWIKPENRIEGLRKEISRLNPREILVQESLLQEDAEIQKFITGRKDLVINTLPDWSFDRESSNRRLLELFGVVNLKGFGCGEEDPEILSAGVLVEYLRENAKNALVHIRNFRKYSDGDFLVLDESTLKNLELVRNLQDGSEKYTLFAVVNHTRTAMGTRLLRRWILEPLVDADRIIARRDVVDRLYHDQNLLNRVRNGLSRIFDLERLSARIALDKAHGKDLLAVKESLAGAASVYDLMRDLVLRDSMLPPETLKRLAELQLLLERAVAESPSILLTEGNIIKNGFDRRLDDLRELQTNRKKVLDAYLEEEKKVSGIYSLRIRYNRIIGYFLEVTKSQTGSVPAHFIRRQSLVGGERYTTDRLIELETLLNTSLESIVELERELFLNVRSEAKSCIGMLSGMSRFLAETDALQSLAQAATLHGFSRPEIVRGTDIMVSEGRHPVVEMYLPPGEFVPNALRLRGEEKSFALITGPNMAGKSTYLRQTALLIILAQIGSFVPAGEAEIGVVDKIFCRVGAQDNLARGESTFLVEMNETANILRSATKKSLIIMDEVGRGTSTNDGLAIAWAVCEYILDSVGSKTLFATHYHELTVLQHKNLYNLSMDIREENGNIVFLKRIKEGPSNNSYGIHVARLAGLPASVLEKAAVILENLVETKEGAPVAVGSTAKPAVKQQNLFSSREILEQEVFSFPVERSTPLEALNFIAKWKKIIQSEKKNA